MNQTYDDTTYSNMLILTLQTLNTHRVKTFDQLLITQAVICVKPGVKVLRKKKKIN